MNIVEHLRKTALEDIFNIPTFQRCWAVWKPNINEILGENWNETDLLNLGDSLSDIFKGTRVEGRNQSSLSGGGAAWEALVCYYINLCTIGSRVVAIRRMSLVPKPIQDAITVNYSNFPCNTESDITLLVFPDKDEFNQVIGEVSFTSPDNITTSLLLRNSFNRNILNHLIDRYFNEFEIGVIQCKTNWNDNAQIPMLWDMIYSAGGFSGRNITIGINNYSIQNCRNFTYSFVTVPSNTRTIYRSSSVAVNRVYNLSGGNYWGKPTENNICRSLKEIFNNNYSSGLRGIGTRGLLRENINEIKSNNGLYSYFDLN